MKWLTNRSSFDLIIITIAATICLILLSIVGTTILLIFLQPERELTGAVNLIAGILNTLIGLLAGFIAGKTRDVQQIGNKANPGRFDSDGPVVEQPGNYDLGRE